MPCCSPGSCWAAVSREESRTGLQASTVRALCGRESNVSPACLVSNMQAAVMPSCTGCVTVSSSYLYWFERLHLLKSQIDSSVSDATSRVYILFKYYGMFRCYFLTRNDIAVFTLYLSSSQLVRKCINLEGNAPYCSTSSVAECQDLASTEQHCCGVMWAGSYTGKDCKNFC